MGSGGGENVILLKEENDKFTVCACGTILGSTERLVKQIKHKDLFSMPSPPKNKRKDKGTGAGQQMCICGRHQASVLSGMLMPVPCGVTQMHYTHQIFINTNLLISIIICFTVDQCSQAG